MTGTINGSTIATRHRRDPGAGERRRRHGRPAAQTQATGLTITFHTDDTSATFECSLDGEPFAACTSPYTRGGLADGAHALRIHAVNGNATNPEATIA